MQRLFFIALGIIAFIISYSIGASISFDEKYATKMREEFLKKIEGIDYVGIFFNNFIISLSMFIPAFGTIFGLFSAFSTGSIFSALSQNSPILTQVSPLIILLTPFGILEMVSYGIAISRSGILFFRIVKKKNLRNEIIPTLIEVGIVFVLLFLGAAIEWNLISQTETLNSKSSNILNSI